MLSLDNGFSNECLESKIVDLYLDFCKDLVSFIEN